MTPTFGDLRAAIASARRVLAFDSRDWGKDRSDAWLWGILCGWDEGMEEMAALHRWSKADVEQLRCLHAAVAAHQTAFAHWGSVADLQAAYSEDELDHARLAARRLTAVLIGTAHLLDVPFTNEPEASPWTLSVSPALKALRAALGMDPSGPVVPMVDSEETP